MNLHKTLLAALCVATALFASAETPAKEAAQQISAEEKAYLERMAAIAKSLHPQTGDVAITEAKVTMHLGQDYYYLNAEDSRKVIVEAWGNPKAQGEGVLGMVFPKNTTFMDAEGWGAVITYQAEGHVADDDAANVNFDDLLTQLREGEEDENKAREEQGFQPMHLAGWAERPAYDRTTHSVIWARDLQVGENPDHSLNYDVRLLGRNGVLSLNMISTMSQLPQVKAAARKFADTAKFDGGFAYNDYVEGVDKAAGYGIGGLVAAGVGVAAAKKLGLLAVVLGFGKKFIVLLLMGAAAAWRWIARLFGKRGDEALVYEEPVMATGADETPQSESADASPAEEQSSPG